MDMISHQDFGGLPGADQVTTRPDRSRPSSTRPATARRSSGSCATAAAISARRRCESIDLDDLIRPQLDDPSAFSAEIKSFHG